MLNFRKVGQQGPIANLGKPAQARPATAIQSPGAAKTPLKPATTGPAPAAPAPAAGGSGSFAGVQPMNPVTPTAPNPSQTVQQKVMANRAMASSGRPYQPPVGVAGRLGQTGGAPPATAQSAAGMNAGGIEQTPARANIPASNETAAPAKRGA